MYKRDIVNFLFIISFPIYGVGTYVSAVKSPSMGFLISLFPHLLILIFYVIDLLYRGEFRVRINKYYYLMLVFILSSVASLFISLYKGMPEMTLSMTIVKSILLIVPFHAFLVVVLYNEVKGGLLRLTLLSLSMLLAINVAAYFGLGMSNATHSIEGRLNFPFLDGFYSGAGLLAIINLLLLYYLQRTWKDPVRFVSLGAYFLVNLAMFFLINSRLTILVFTLVMFLFILGAMRMRGLFLISMFTIPILMSSGVLLYKVLQLPGMSSLIQRVDIEDVTTFNGRAFLWRDASDWLIHDQEGLVFGNGYKGHYFLNTISDVAKLWNERDLHHMHFHSSSLEVLVSQGIFFLTIFGIIFYQLYRYFKVHHQAKGELGAFLPVVIFLMFLLQIDTFVYMESLGFVIISVLVARIAISPEVSPEQSPQRIMDKALLENVLSIPEDGRQAELAISKSHNP